MNKYIVKTVHLVGGMLTLTGALLYFFELGIARYLFAFGVIALIGVQVVYLVQTKQENVRTQRMMRLMLVAVLLLGFGAYLMFVNDERWVILMLIYVLISVFLALRAEKR